MSKLSPYVRYRKYIDGLMETGGKLPTNRSGDVNFKVIAEKCGNRRQWFSENINKIFDTENNRDLGRIIEFDAKTIGTDFVKPKTSDTVLSEMARDKSIEAGKLKSSLEKATKSLEFYITENLKLQKKLDELENKAKETSDVKDELLNSGRFFSL